MGPVRNTTRGLFKNKTIHVLELGHAPHPISSKQLSDRGTYTSAPKGRRSGKASAAAFQAENEGIRSLRRGRLRLLAASQDLHCLSEGNLQFLLHLQ